MSNIDELAKRTKQRTCRKVGIKREPDEHISSEAGDVSSGPFPPDADGNDTSRRPSANATKRRKQQNGAPSSASDESGVGLGGFEELAAVPTMSETTTQRGIEGCLQIVASMPDSSSIYFEAMKILVQHRLPASAFAFSNDLSDTASWVASHRCMQDQDASTVMQVIQALEKAEGDTLANALLDKLKSPIIIQTICERLKAHIWTLSRTDGDAAEPQPESDRADSQVAASRQVSSVLPTNEDHAEASWPKDQPDSARAPRLKRHASSTEVRSSQRIPPGTISPPEMKSMLPTFVDFVEVEREDNLWYILVPVDTPELPIKDVTLHELKYTCRTAFALTLPVSFVKAEQVNGVWYAAFKQRGRVSGHYLNKIKLVGKRLRIRDTYCTARYMPFTPPMLFAADVTMSADISVEGVTDLLERALSARGVSMPTLIETMGADNASRRLTAQFHVSPALLYFCVQLPKGGSTTPTAVCFWPVDPSETGMDNSS